jgi:RNA 2',3'-cyclic 3'-phosphodiesterase
MTIRSFLAFELPKPMKSVLSVALEDLRKGGLDVRWTAVENIHMTVLFLGGVPESGLDFIIKSAAQVCSRHDPFNAAVKGMGVFGPKRRPRVLWAGVSGEISRMASFKRELLDALAPAGMNLDPRPFKPHLTLGRFRSGGPGNLLELFGNLQSEQCRLDELVLFKSDLRPKGAVHSVLERMPMKGRPYVI